jgi:glyoxylase-like metal-dependent hydrolase (beta-lactamase superfamily II)
MGNEFFRFKVGDFNCLAINDRDDWDCLVLVVDTGQQRVMIDTGCGDTSSPPGRLLERLQAAGMSAAEIDVVIFSHADCDHIGGAVEANGQPAFPRARYLLAREEWAFRLTRPVRFRREDNTFFDEAFFQWSLDTPVVRLAQLRDKLELFDAGAKIVPGVWAIAASGHTPGMVAIAISSGQEPLLFIADIVYGADLHAGGLDGSYDIGNPKWHAFIDMDPAQALVTRDRVFEQAAKTQTLLMAAHTPFPGLGYVVKHGPGWRWETVTKIPHPT